MWTCVAYFRVSPREAENLPFCALLKNDGQYRVVRAASDQELQQYSGTDTARFLRIAAARPKAVFVNTYVSIGDIATKATVLDQTEVDFPPIDE